MIARRTIPRPKALWTQLPGARLMPSPKGRQREKNGAAGSRTFTRSKSFVQSRKPVRKIRPETASRKRRYNTRVKVWLTQPENRFCKVFPNHTATQCHHRRGRILTKKGDLLFLESEWLPVSAAGHGWIGVQGVHIPRGAGGYEQGWKVRCQEGGGVP